MRKENERFKFSVIIPIYNVEKYLEECIDSIINQTIGFKQNIQLILVNDGSPDNSGKICESYKKKYPNNIMYIKQKNNGVSSARNEGLKHVKGEIVNFCDPDDYFNLDVFELVEKFLKENNEIKLVSTRIKFFEARTGFGHPLDYKFEETKVVDLGVDYSFIQLSSIMFYKKEILSNREFDENIKYGEDAKFVNEILINLKKYGVIREAVYNYRKRESGNSALNKTESDSRWYINTLQNVFLDLIQKCKNENEVIPKFVQYIAAYHLQWVIKSKKTMKILSEGELKQHIDLLKKIYSNIDDEIIMEQRNTNNLYKKYAIELKYGKEYDLPNEKSDQIEVLEKMCDEQLKNICNVIILEMKDNKLYLEGKFCHYINKEYYSMYFQDGKGRKYIPEIYEYSHRDVIGINGEKIYKEYGFKVEIPVGKIKKIMCVYKVESRKARKIRISLGEFAKISKIEDSYYYNQGYIVNIKENYIYSRKVTKFQHLKYELKYLRSLFITKQGSVILNRLLYYMIKPFIKKPIWIISDRPEEAKDNGIAFYKYVVNNKEINSYFAIKKESKEYVQIKEYGKVIDFGSQKYKLLMLLATNVISSQGERYIYAAFGENQKYYKDLQKFNYVFLQHGITKDDLSNWLHKLHKNIKIFVTTVNGEYNDIALGRYGYDKNIVKLLGFPRYDYLESATTKKIVLLPTWRKNIVSNVNQKTQKRDYVEKFKYSEYCEFYNGLIQSKKLDEELGKAGYSFEYYLHPSTIEQVSDFFSECKNIKIKSETADYSKIFKEASLIVTDYSSVAFDFAYLNKPVIYTQFDEEIFFENHTYKKGYFDYERDGLGKVVYNLEDTIEEIIKNIKNDCIIEEKYKERSEKFFKYRDKNNCKRVYEEIVKLNKNN